MKKMNLRRATPADAPALAKVHVTSWQRIYRGIVSDSFLKYFTIEHRNKGFDQSLSSRAEETYVAELNGQIVGFLTLGECRDTDVDPKVTGEIWGIYLSPDHWRKGIGRFLSVQGESMLISRGHSFAKLWVLEANQPARRFYEEMGFEVDGKIKEVKLGCLLMAIRYHKELKGTERKFKAES